LSHPQIDLSALGLLMIGDVCPPIIEYEKDLKNVDVSYAE
jgi:hypothetical protein